MMVLKSENKKRRVTMNKLPDEIVLSILSRLTVKEVARARLVSRKWDNYSHHIHVLNFEDPIASKRMLRYAVDNRHNYFKVIKKERCDFVNKVNNVLNRHVGCIVDEFKVVFFLNAVHQHVIDSWVVWAFSKHVEKLELDLSPPLAYHVRARSRPDMCHYVLDLPVLESCNTKFHLTSLCLKMVQVTTQVMECFLKTCGPKLEYLCIEKSNVLTSITDASLPSLKYLRLYDCPNVETVHIQTPKLVTFEYYPGWYSVLSLLNIENASTLSDVSILVVDEDLFFYVLHSLFKYFSHLEYLKLDWYAKSNISPVRDNFPALANLKNLKLITDLPINQTMGGWIPFIGACPLLQSLTLLLRGRFRLVQPKIECHDKCPFPWLKTLEIKNFNGYNCDVDIVSFVLQNAPALQEVILHISSGKHVLPLNLKAPFAGVGLELPPHVNIVIV